MRTAGTAWMTGTKPGQGELELFLGCHRQPSSVNPTAVDLAPAEGLYDRRQYAE